MLTIDQFLADREKDYQKLQDDLQKVQTELQGKREATAAAHSKYADAQNELQSIRQLWSEVARGTTRRDELESLTAQYTSMQTDVLRHQHRLDDLNAELDSLKAHLNAIVSRKRTFAARLHQPTLDCGLVVERRTAGAWIGKDSVASAIAHLAQINNDRAAALAVAKSRLAEMRAMCDMRRRSLQQIEERVHDQVSAATAVPRGALAESEVTIAAERARLQSELEAVEKEIEAAKFHLRRGHSLAGNEGKQSALVVHAPFSEEKYVLDTRVSRLKTNDTPTDDEVAKAQQVLEMKEKVLDLKRQIRVAKDAKDTAAVRLRVEKQRLAEAKLKGGKTIEGLVKKVDIEEKRRASATESAVRGISNIVAKLRDDIENLNATVKVQSKELSGLKRRSRAFSPPQPRAITAGPMA